jgi:hypothetical protein
VQFIGEHGVNVKELLPGALLAHVVSRGFFGRMGLENLCSVSIVVSLSGDFPLPGCSREMLPHNRVVSPVAKSKIDFQEGRVFFFVIPREFRHNFGRLRVKFAFKGVLAPLLVPKKLKALARHMDIGLAHWSEESPGDRVHHVSVQLFPILFRLHVSDRIAFEDFEQEHHIWAHNVVGIFVQNEFFVPSALGLTFNAHVKKVSGNW